MSVVFLVFAAILLAGWLFDLPRGLVWGLIILLFAAVFSAVVFLPEESGLRRAIGGTPAGWGTVIGVVVLIGAYIRLLRVIRARVAPQEAVQSGPFSDAELGRYARQITLREIGGPGQLALKQAKVLVVGAGGLGSPVLQYLAASGVGLIGVIDDDEVDNSNLARQVIHRDADIGRPKVFSAEAAMRAQNPSVEVKTYNRRLSEENAKLLIAEYDLVIDGTDSFDSRYLVNRAAAAEGVPMIGGALSQWEGMVSVYDPASGAPCYQCVFPEAPAPGLAPSCAEAGVVSPLPGVVGSMMALEAIKEVTGAGEGLRGRLLIFDGLSGESRMMKTKRRADCPVCGAG
ncbi:MAG: molybdopterin biosynthesis protein [Rhodobacterales bacterium]|nr:MAG: molybdopterin biosynthesis protein [Rhodobacterales bacterium]